MNKAALDAISTDATRVSEHASQPPSVGDGIADAGAARVPQGQADMHYAQGLRADANGQRALPEPAIAAGGREASPVLGGDDHAASYAAGNRRQAPAPYRCIKPQCPTDCSMCNHAIPSKDAALVLIADLLDGLAVDGFDGPLEDGESALVDRARKFLADTRNTRREALDAPDDETVVTEFALRSACGHLGTLVDRQREALRTARTLIQEHRDELVRGHFDPKTGSVDEDGQRGLDEYDAVLAQIDALLPEAAIPHDPTRTP